MYNSEERDSYARDSLYWVVMPFQRLAWRMTRTLKSHFGKPWVSFSGGNIRHGASGAGAGVTEGAIMERTMRFMTLVGHPVSGMDATLPSSRITENKEEVELGLPWVTDWGAKTWTYDGT
jgi:hypothetical protein